ncbi:MAG: hypothetical protein HC848_01345 [Limnobacter sp.]|nr:hypothetical protein [Limnobacter sp.]
MGHSLGFAHLLNTPVHWESLSCLHGFLRFGTPTRVLQRMAQQLVQHPAKVLAAFQERCGLPQPELLAALPQTLPGKHPLLEHLHTLQTLNLPQERVQAQCARLLVVTSHTDPIAPASLAPRSEQTHSIAAAHAGPALHPQAYTQVLLPFVAN